ncbi:hypothetical protein [Stutzerimonas frequens]|uniref:hypothetical protein n=1 Tax=Stutzerimonas frequens TaxID=2968969 RepID=UPI0025541413|nr:hypothetical protein [Stutzerimonas frequens]MDL0441870.1 hypothetical protein [Stutzerimonas frequens]
MERKERALWLYAGVTIAAALVLCIGTLLLLVVDKLGGLSATSAAWVQAFGSIAAIIGAAWFPYLHEARKTAEEVRSLETRIGGLSMHLHLIIDEMQALLGPSENVPAYDHIKIEIIAAELNREICGVALEEKGLVTIADLIMLRAAADQATRIATRIAKTIQTRGAVNLFDKEPELRRFYLMMKSTKRELKPVVKKLT